MTSTFACSGDPFSFMNTLQFAVYVDWILFCFLRKCALLAMSAFFFVRCLFMYTSDRFSFLPCLPLFSVRKVNYYGRFLTFVLLLLSTDIPLLLKKAITCHSRESSSGTVGSPTSAAAAALACNQGLVSNLLTIKSFMWEYCSRSLSTPRGQSSYPS